MDPLVAAQIAVAAVQDILFAIAVGTLACDAMLEWRFVAVPAATGRWRLRTLGMLVIACCLYLWLQAALMSGAPMRDAGSAIRAVLTQSHFGVAWWIGFAGAVLGSVASIRRTRAAWVVAAAGTVVYATGKAAASHAADAGDFSVPEAVHVVHLCATALWAGSVMVATCILRGSGEVSFNTPARRAMFSAQLSHLATAALGVVLVTGIFNVVRNTAHVTMPLLANSYGHILTVKLVLVTLAILLGGYNRLIYLPDLQPGRARGGRPSGEAQRRFDHLLLIEAVTMLAALMVAASLGHTSPSGG